jgi:serine/threonine-protein kinase
MEALTGRSMGEAFESSDSFSLDMLIHIMSEVLRGLSTVHDAGIVHRDLKPENIFLVRERDDKLSPKLLDFGISRSLEPDTRRSAVTTTEGLILGTPQYMSPEQARGLGNIDKRTDIYSVGIILFESLAGFVPFDSENMGDLLLKVIRGKAPPLQQLVPQIGPALCQVVDKALAKSRDLRYSDAAEMHEALVAAAAQIPAEFDRTARLFPPQAVNQAEPESPSEFPLGPDNAASDPNMLGLRRTRRERRRSDDEDQAGPPVRKPTPHSGDLTVERGAEASRVLPRWAPWLLGTASAAALIASVVFALVTRGNSSGESGFIVVQASGPPREVAEKPTATSQHAPEPATRAASPELPAVQATETRARRSTSTTKPKGARAKATPASGGTVQQRAADVASAFSRQKAAVTDCLDQHPDDMEGAPQLIVRVRVEPSGRVGDATLLPESISSKPVGRCVAQAVATMSFAQQQQATTFRIPLLWRRK